MRVSHFLVVCGALVSVNTLSAQLNTVHYFNIPQSAPEEGIVAGTDGELWLTAGTYIERIPISGEPVTSYALPNNGVGAFYGITTGVDGNIWFTTSQSGGISYIGRICTMKQKTYCPNVGSITECRVPSTGVEPLYIISGSDGNLWFTEFKGSHIGKIAPFASDGCPQGAITEYADATGSPYAITAGLDGQLWFTETNSQVIKTINTSGSITSTFNIAGYPGGGAITTGPDGAIWFPEQVPSKGSAIGRICALKSPTNNCPYIGYSNYVLLPKTTVTSLWGITPGADGALWFGALMSNGTTALGRITTDGKTVNYFTIPNIWGMSSGPDGSIWFTVGPQVGQAIPTAQRNGIDMNAKALGDPYVKPPSTYYQNLQAAGVKYVVYESDHLGDLNPQHAIADFAVAGFGVATYCELYFDGTHGDGKNQAQTCLNSVGTSLNLVSFFALAVETKTTPACAPSVCVDLINNAIATLTTNGILAQNILIYTKASDWSTITGNLYNSEFTGYKLWNAGRGHFTGYTDPAENLYCAPNQAGKISGLVPGYRTGTGIPGLVPPNFGPWVVEHGDQFDDGSNEGVDAACLFHVVADFDYFDPSMFPTF